MAEYQSSNITTYQTDDGRPVYDAFFVQMTVAGRSALIAFTSEELRNRALTIRTAEGSTREAVKARDAYDRMRQGEPAWIFEDERDFATCYTPLELSGGFKGGWKPRVVQGGRLA